MSMKKILSIVVALSLMAVSTVANAAEFTYGDTAEVYGDEFPGAVLIKSELTEQELQAVTPSVEYKVTQLTAAEVGAMPTDSVLTAAKKMLYKKTENYTVYKINGKMTDFPALYTGYDAELGSKSLQLFSITSGFGVSGDKAVTEAVTAYIAKSSNDMGSGSVQYGRNDAEKTLSYFWAAAATTADSMFPQFTDMGSVNDAFAYEFDAYVVLPASANTLQLTAAPELVYFINGTKVVKTLNTQSVALAPAPATVAVTGVTVTPETATLTVDETVALTATVEPAEATNKAVTWTSNADSIASVSAEGVVTAKAPGEATITATTADGSFTDTCVVTVKAAPVVFSFTVGGVAGPVAGTVVENPAGVVWANCVMKNVDTAVNTYVAKFSAEGYEDADRKTTLNLNGVDTSGDVTFDAVMWFAGKAKTGVTMDVEVVPAE